MITRRVRTGFALVFAAVFSLSGRNGMIAEDKPAVQQIALPGPPFGVAATKDLQWIFVSITDGGKEKPGIAVLHNGLGGIKLKREILMGRSPTGIVLSHDESTLIAAAGDYVVFFDTKRLEAGSKDAAYQWVARGERAGCIYVNLTADDKTLFVSDEFKETITVIDLGKIQSMGRDSARNLRQIKEGGGPSSAIIGRIPVGRSPVALTFSKDERWLFTTSEVAAANWKWPRKVLREGAKASHQMVPEGAVVVIDVAKAKFDPVNSVVAKIPAGGSPVRAGLSPDGKRLFVSARSGDALLVFQTADLCSGSERISPIIVPVGKSPVPVISTSDGKFVLVGNSNRYSAGVTSASTLTVIDISRIGTTQNPVVGNIPCGAFPRNFFMGADGRTLLLTNFQSMSLQVIDSSRLSELLRK